MGEYRSALAQRRNQWIIGGIAVVLVVGVVGCSWIGGGSDGQAPEPTLVGGMRTVPTVPPSGPTDSVVPVDQAVVEGAGGVSDSAAPTTTVYVGDVAGGDAEALPPPETVPGQVPEACTRLADYRVADLVGTAGGTPAIVESIWDGACRMTAGSVVAEVHFVPEATVLDDWYVREGIEPVGEVGGDAVGLDGFLAPGSEPSEGYTIAMVNARQGVVVAVRGVDIPRDLAVAMAIAAGQAIQ